MKYDSSIEKDVLFLLIFIDAIRDFESEGHWYFKISKHICSGCVFFLLADCEY
jgi:hypothetical protein